MQKHGKIPLPIIPVALAFSALLAIFGSCVNPDVFIPNASKGSLDLSMREGILDGTVALNGEWEFYPSELRTPESFAADTSADDKPIYVKLPAEGLWSSITINDTPLSPYGFATLRLVVNIPECTHSLALRTPEFFASGRIFFNGKEIYKAGNPGKTAKETKPWYKTGIIYIHPQTGDNEIIIHIANFTERRGGINKTLWIGDAGKLQSSYGRSLAMDLLIFGSILAMGLYHLCLFWIRKKDRAWFWFGLFCIFIAVRTLLYGERFAFELLSGVPWAVFNRLDHLSFYIGIPIFSAYLVNIFEKDIARVPLYLYQGLGVLFSLMLFFPPVVFNTTVAWYEIITGIYVLYIFYVIILAFIRKREGATLTLVGVAIFLCFGINEILFNMGIINTFNSLSIGLALFLFTQSVLIAKRFSKAFEESEQLGQSLLNLNMSLRRFIPQEFFMLLKKKRIEDIALGDQVEKNISIMFSDIRRFTMLSEQIGPKETFQFLNDYYGRIGQIIRSHGGFIDKYLGDGFIALFPESPDAALKAAIGIQQVICEINKDREKNALPLIETGIGLNYGPLVLGTVGEEHRMDTTVIADAVNLSSRLEGLSKQYGKGTIVPFAFLDLLLDPEKYHWRYLGLIRVQGRKEPVEAVHIFDGLNETEFNLFNSTKDRFEDALHSYRNGDYEAAMQEFRQLAVEVPDDPAVFTFMTQIHRLLKSGIIDNWDGTTIAEK